jgi:regulator of protease activity HflC (stomatin/prohibitin superfamily)
VARFLLMLRVTVKDGERALLLRNGRYERVLDPGRHRLFDPKRTLTVETFKVVQAEFPADHYAVIKAERPDLAAALFEAVETRADELAIVSLDGRPTHLVGPWKLRVFWKVATAVTVERIDTASDPKVDPRHLALIDRAHNPFAAETVVEKHEAGLAYILQENQL